MLGVLDGAVLVVSAVEGVQAQTRVLMRTLRRLRIPTLLFVNKIDRGGAQDERLLRASRGKLGARRGMGSVARAGTRAAELRPVRRRRRAAGCWSCSPSTTTRCSPRTWTAVPRCRTARCAPRSRRRPARRSCTRCSSARPSRARAWTPSRRAWASSCRRRGATPAARRGHRVQGRPRRAGEKIAYVRLFSGTVRRARPAARRRAQRGQGHGDPRVRGRRRTCRARPSRPGRSGSCGASEDVRIGDALGVARPGAGPRLRAADARDGRRAPPAGGPAQALRRARPTRRAGSADRLPAGRATGRSSRSRSTGRCRRRSSRPRWPTTSASRRPSGRRRRSASSARSARAPPASSATRIRIRCWRRSGSGWTGQRRHLRPGGRARLDALRLLQGGRGDRARDAAAGGLHGWRVSDCRVTMTHAGYWPRQSHAHATFDKSMSSTAGDFRALAPLVLMRALGEAGTEVLEPLHALPARAAGGHARRGAARARAAGSRARAAGAPGRDVRARGRAAGRAGRTPSRARCPG